MPADCAQAYALEELVAVSWGDFLGYGVGNPPGTLVQFEEARELVREQKLATTEKW